MIDLRYKSLPNAITVDGKDFLIKTDFREWIKFRKLAEEPHQLKDYYYLFVDEVPYCDFFPYLVDFYLNPNTTPHGNDVSTDKVIDFIEDGEYIIASFWKDYGINLLETDMHWHLFQALFIGLSDDTKIKKIMSMRGWKKDKKTFEQRCREDKEAWSFPKITTQEEQELIEEINKLFYNA